MKPRPRSRKDIRRAFRAQRAPRRVALAGIVQSRRLELGLTLAEVGQRARLSESIISYIESGGRRGFRPSTLKCVAVALDLPPDLLLLAAGIAPEWATHWFVRDPHGSLSAMSSAAAVAPRESRRSS